MAKKCPPGKYYCFDDKKCKKIPRGYHIGARGYLARGDNRSDSGNGNGNGSSNGNGNGGNGSGNGNGGSGGNGGGNGGGGMGESIIYEKSNPRIPRKAGQPAKSKKHSDLYTDEDPKGTIHGLGFKNVAKARASVSKIRNSSRSHAHKIQAAVAMEQRAREMGKTSEAAVYRKYINSMKKKTKRMNEAVSAAQQAAIAIDMKKKGKKPKSVKEAVVTDDKGRVPSDGSNAKLTDAKYTRKQGDGSRVTDSKDRKLFKTDGSRVTRTEGMYNHTDVGLITNAVVELEDGLKTLKTITYDSVDQLMQGIAKRNDISPTLLHNQFKAKHFTIPDDWAIRYRMNKMKGIEEATMTSAQKRKDTMLKKKYDKSDMKKSMQKQYGKEEGKKVYFATIRKQAMEGVEDDKYNVSEEGLRDWFGKSSGTTKSGRKVRGWVQVGGKYDGKPCARQPGQKSTPKCVSSSKRRSMSKSERDSAARRKRAADPNQPQKSGAAKPTNVSTDPKRKMKENYFNRKKVVDEAKVTTNYNRNTNLPIGDRGSTPSERSAVMQNVNDKKASQTGMVTGSNHPDKTKKKVEPQPIKRERGQVMQDSYVLEAKDKKGKGSGTKDACYHKVKSRYSVWPSAYASGALVKCRKVGAANWGNKSKNEGFSPMQVAALEAAGMIEIKEGKKCWKGYKKAGTQKLFGKTYNRCVKAGDELNHDGEQLSEMGGNLMGGDKSKITGGEASKQMTPDSLKSVRKNKRNENIRNLANNPGTKGEESAALAKKKPQAELPKFESYAPVTEGVAFLKRKKEEKKKSKSQYLTQRDAGKLAKRKMAKKDQEKVNFLEPEETNESKTRLVKNGHTYKVVLTWRGKTYMVQMFVPSVSRPTRQQVEKEVQKIYPDAKLMSFLPRDLEPGEPTVMMGEEKHKRDEYGDIVGGPKISKKDKKKNLAKNEKDEQHTTTTSESYSSKPSNLKKKAKLTAVLNRLQDLKVKKKMGEEYLNELDTGPEGLVQRAFDKAKQNFRDAKTDSERGKAEAHKKSFSSYAVRKRRQGGNTPEINQLGKKKSLDVEIPVIPEEQDPEGMKLSDVQRIKRQKQLSDAAKKAPEVKNKIVPIKTSTTEEVIHEDDMKGMSVKSGHKRPTKAGAGMTKKGVEAYRRRNPGSKLKTAVTTKPSKLKKGSKAANRRKSYCARSAGQMKKFPKAAKDPNSRLRQARRRWNC